MATSKAKKRCINLNYVGTLVIYSLVTIVGLFYLGVSIVGTQLMILCSLGYYLVGLLGIRKIVQKLKLVIPNERVTRLHVANILMYLLSSVIVTSSMILMLNMLKSNEMIVEGPDVANYLKVSFAFDLSCAVNYLFESVTCFIAGHFIVLYSENERATRKDPITHLEVSSLVFAFNQQQIIDSLAGVRTETYEQYVERLQR